MFNKLRLKLTLTNVIVVSIIFLIFVLSIFFVMGKIVNDQTEQLINLISSSEGVNIAPKKDQPEHEEHQYRYFYIKLNPSGKVISTSINLDLDKTQLDKIISKAITSKRNRGVIEVGHNSFHFAKNPIRNNLGTFIIFVDTHGENKILENLLTVLILAGIGGLILAFFGSLFMANKSIIPIRESWNRQKDFVADASHELRTPLAVIETTIDLLAGRREYTIESQMKWLDNIQTENKRMTKLVSDLLLLARADSEQDTLLLKSFSLHLALLEAYIPFEAMVLQHGIYLEPFDGQQIDFWGDESKIKQLVVILVDNAIKYTPTGGHVGMTLKDAGDTVEICVFDTGEGIPEEHLSKIFQRFSCLLVSY